MYLDYGQYRFEHIDERCLGERVPPIGLPPPQPGPGAGSAPKIQGKESSASAALLCNRSVRPSAGLALIDRRELDTKIAMLTLVWGVSMRRVNVGEV